MSALTVILRDLRRLARQSYTFWGRAVFGVLAFCGLWGTALAVDLGFVSGVNKGKAILWLLSQLMLFLCAIAGVVTTSDSLSEERREGTLGLLFLTPLRPLDLLLGRLVAASVTLVYRFMAVIPVVGLTMLFGGVAPGEFARLALLLSNALLLSLVIGLFVSCVATVPRVALTTSFFITGLVYIGPFFFWGVTGMLGHQYTVKDILPVLSLSPIFALAYSGCLHPWVYDPNYFGWSLATSHALSWLLFGSGALLLKRSVRSETNPVSGLKWGKNRGNTSAIGKPNRARTRLRKRLLDSAPYSWLMARNGNTRARVEGYLLALFLIGAVSWWKLPGFQGFAVFLLCFAIGFVKVWFLIETVTRISDERGKGSFELLLSSPLGVSGIIRGVDQALWRQFGRGVIALFVIAGWLYHSLNHSSSRELERDYQTAFWLVVIAVLIDLWALKWAGIWSGLKAKGNSRAYLGPLAIVFLIPWLTTFLVGGGISFYREALRSHELVFSELMTIWMWCSFPIVFAYGWRARYQVIQRTWSLAMHGFDYGSAESEWILAAASVTDRKTSVWSKLPWPKTFRRQVWASCGIVLLGLLLFGQGRRLFYERQFRGSLATFPVLQVPLPQNVQGSYTPELGVIPSSLYDALALCVPPASSVAGSDIRAIDPAVSGSPSWERAYSLAKRLEVLEQVRQKNQRTLSRLLVEGPIVEDPDSTELRTFRSWNEVQLLFAAFDVLGCEIYYRVLKQDLEPASRAFMSAARLQDYLGGQQTESFDFAINGGNGTRLDPWLRLLLSREALSESDLTELEAVLLRMEERNSGSENISMRLQYLEAYADLDFFSTPGRQGMEIAIQRAFMGLRQVTGKNAKEWAALVDWSEEFLLALKKLDQGDPSLYVSIGHPFRVSQRRSMLQSIGSMSEMIATGFVREVDRWVSIRARLRIMICAVALERARIRTGSYPSSLAETPLTDDLNLMTDPYSGKPFRYSITEDGYLLESASVWPWVGAAKSVGHLEWRIPVASAALEDSE